MRFAWVLALLVSMTAVIDSAEAKYLHCYSEQANDEIEVGPPELKRKLLFLEHGLAITIYRKACFLTDQSDRRYVRSLYGQAGCTSTSDVGRIFDRVFQVDIAEIEGWSGFRAFTTKYPKWTDDFCGLVEASPWPVFRSDLTPISPELFSAYQNSLQAIEAFLERDVAERDGYP